MRIIKNALKCFRSASGQIVSYEKSSMYCSKSVNSQEAHLLSSSVGFTLVDDLEKYLGVPLLHKRVKKGTYQAVVDRCLARLSTWQAKSLSLAGRITLVEAIILAIPNYTMQSTLLPLGFIAQIERLCRQFLWGANSNER